MDAKTMKVVVVGFAGALCATAAFAKDVEYKFTGASSDRLDDPANWSGDISSLAADDWAVIGNSGNPCSTVTLGGDMTIAGPRVRVENITLDLGKGRTLSSTSTSGYGFVVGHTGYTMNLVSGSLSIPGCALRLGTYSAQNGHALITGADTFLTAKGVTFSGLGKGSCSVLNGATVNGCGGKFSFCSSGNRTVIADSTVTNITGFALDDSGETKNSRNLVCITNSIVQASDSLVACTYASAAGNTCQIANGALVKAAKLDLYYGSGNVIEVTGEGSELEMTSRGINTYPRISGVSNRVEITNGAVFRGGPVASANYSSFSLGYLTGYNGDGIGNEICVSGGGKFLVNGKVIVAETLYAPSSGRMRENRLVVSGSDSAVVAGKGIEFGGAYNEGGKNKCSSVVSNVICVSDGGVISNLAGRVYLPRQGIGNRTTIDGGTFFAAENVVTGTDQSDLVTTNNVIEIKGAGRMTVGGSFYFYGTGNALRVEDGILNCNAFQTAGGRDFLIEVGPSGQIVSANQFILYHPSVIRYVLPTNGTSYAAVPIVAKTSWFQLAASCDIEFPNLLACARAGGGEFVLAKGTWMDVPQCAAIEARLQSELPRAKLFMRGTELVLKVPDKRGMCIIVR